MNARRWGSALIVLAWSFSAPTAVFAASPSVARITLSVNSGPPGTLLTISGTGFPADEIVALYIDAPTGFIGAPGPKADAQGNFVVPGFPWPGKGWDPSGHVNPSKAGSHNLCGDTMWPSSTQTIPGKACAQFLVPIQPSSQPQSNTDFGRLFLLALVGFALLIGAAAGAIIWTRRSAT